MTEAHKVYTFVTAFYQSMVGVAYFLCVFSVANLKLQDNLKFCGMDINGDTIKISRVNFSDGRGKA